MNAKLKEIWAKILESLKKVSKKGWILLAVALVLTAAAVAIILNSRPYAVLFTGLSGDEASSIMTYLEEQGVTNYRLENNNTILVPRKQEPLLKARLLMQGYPRSGFAYSTYFDNVGALTTESERNFAYLADLQDRMGAVIKSMDGVAEAVVTIAQGEDRGYVLDSGNVVEASASVIVTMRNGGKLTNQQASAIRNLVARAVQGLEVDSITIADNLGNQYSAGDGSAASGDASDLKLRLEEENSNKIRTQIMQVLVPMFGEENVKVAVNCIVDVDRTTIDRTTYEQADWAAGGEVDGEGIIGSVIYDHSIIQPANEVVGGVVGTGANADLPTYVEEEINPDGNEQEIHVSGQKDFDNNEKKEYIVRTAGYLADCTVSVSINSTSAGAVNLENIRTHVARAAGINGIVTETLTAEEYLISKISVLSVPFYVEPMIPIPPGVQVELWMVAAAAAGLLLFLLLLLIIILRGRKKRKRRAEEERQRQEMEALLAAAGVVQAAPAPAGADVMSMQSERSMELRKDIRQFADDNPEIAAQMIRAWLRGGDDNG